ncbi:MAG: SUMF1/EgtB/PvdO family nonheme iron enzyme [Polyangiaceae bacterium]|nr:SUMF1/EgtB/PvdO family nonheme iron enzyme [Polyangiaceae bacterium]
MLAALFGLTSLVACAEGEPIAAAVGGAAGSAAGSGGAAGGGTGGTGGGDTGGTGGAFDDAGDAGDAAPTGACLCDDPSCGACPGTKSVAAGGYGIDAVEVTNEAYATWLLTQPKPKLQSGACAGNTSYVPSQGWPATDGKLPVTHVDFCDAQAYCRWARRRLCGKIGGGANAYADFAESSKSQWHHACTAGGLRDYPYGASYVGSTCNGADYGKGAPVAAGTAAACEGGYPSLRDMSGNVWEWEDSCDATTGASDLCRIRGGSFSQSGAALACGSDSSLARGDSGKSVGFRCCE